MQIKQVSFSLYSFFIVPSFLNQLWHFYFFNFIEFSSNKPSSFYYEIQVICQSFPEEISYMIDSLPIFSEVSPHGPFFSGLFEKFLMIILSYFYLYFKAIVSDSNTQEHSHHWRIFPQHVRT